MREPDVEINGEYLHRWYILPRNRWLNIYLHRFNREEGDSAFHDHPWWNVSILLKGSYIEHFLTKPSKIRKRLHIILRSPRTVHKIVPIEKPVWTLFITGPYQRIWGFVTANGWVRFNHYTPESEQGEGRRDIKRNY